ncbi:DUF6121 family protein [Lacisediminihabitans changchengi]|uniref:Uncharacterized protein n=1 Tax=Lacisediminihabitans changchengi TaxID=2787634 RepID=A0A934SKQ6_9MICO|nr:DUF6121 family protein [Lacisediminihabitans changchengi]MBK4348411.1 hypothetical protein [Lacisediminihabitans changchengi]
MTQQRDSSQRRYEAAVAVFAVVLFIALCIATSGVINLFAGKDVLAERDASILVIPAMFIVAAAALYLGLFSAAGQTGGALVLFALGIGVACYLFFLVSGAVLYSVGSGQPLRGILFLGANALRPFSIALPIIAAVVAVAYLLLVSARTRRLDGRPPRWPWEQQDDDDRRSLD